MKATRRQRSWESEEENKYRLFWFLVIDLIYGRGGQAWNEMRGSVGPGEVQDQGEG